MVEVRWTLQANEDMAQIAEFISIDSIHYARIQLERFFDAAKVLERFPEYGKPVPELNAMEIREILVGNYRIIYRIISANRIDVITVHHSRRLLDRDLFTWFE